MKQVVQNNRTGETKVREIPAPLASGSDVLIATAASAISAGTERSVVELARTSLVGRARQKPEDVLRVLQTARKQGLRNTYQQITATLEEPMPLGYSAAGTVLACGPAVQAFKPGDRVAAAAPHAAISLAGQNLCARIPDNVSFEQAAYTSIASIGLQGIRLAKLSLNESVLVVGLGLIGQICVCILKAQGCRVFGTDLDPARLDLALSLGADRVARGSALQAVRDFSGSYGVDAVLLTAATESNEPIEFASAACRPKGRIVLVGVVGMEIPRPPFFEKELEFTVSHSLGPGRGDAVYEQKGVDYPIGYARWTAQRNMQTVLELMSRGQLPVEKLTSHRFPIERAPEAFDLITTRREPFLGIVLEYETVQTPLRRRIELRASAAKSGSLGVSFIGAGNFARLIMLPALAKLPDIEWRGICTAKGMNAEDTGNRHGFAFAATDNAEIWNDSATSVVFIATRHNLHADLAIAALRAGKHVFVEKPLCIDSDGLNRIAAAVEELGSECPILTVGFNRRFSPAVSEVKTFFTDVLPLSLSYRFAPGHIPKEHWTQDVETGGGRIVGEACHAIDTVTAIAGSPPVRVFAESASADDRVFITVRHENGCVSSISYQAGGDKGLPSERIEVFGGGRTGVVDGWKDGELWSGGKVRRFSAGRDKGHNAEFAAFIDACRKGGDWPILWDQIYGVTWASLMAVRSLREGTAIDFR